ncbi:dockerin type I repeat-containing protein [Fontivita pretiosa]|uniref:dockerin type I repeat-containing protein n=1 Tax=Fontivita pretiosa TaxID=2989684 RepID=UPI003D1666B1
MQLPLNQYQAGQEQTTPVPNGTFESPGPDDGSGNHPNPTGWTRDGNMFAATPTFSNTANSGSFAAQLRDTLFPGSYTQPAPAMIAGANYVLSAYVWNAGRTGAMGQGDLATVKLVDSGNPFNNIAMTLEATASDGGAGSGGYLMYILLNQAQTAAWSGVNVQVIAEIGSVGGAIPTTWAQFDNVSLTPAHQFVAQKWKTNGSGNWSDNANWLGRAPNQPGSVASFTDGITSPQTITVDAPVTVGQIDFNNANRYTLGGSGTLTLEVTFDGFGNQQGVPEIGVLAGSHTIAAPLVLMRDTVIRVGPATSVLTISSDVTPGGTQGFALGKTGAGALEMKNVRANHLDISGGTVRVLATGTANSPSATSRVNTLAVGAGARLDLNNNSLIVNSGSLATVTASIKSALENGGNFDWLGPGIGSTQANVQNTTAGSFLYGLGVVLNDLAQVGGSGPIYTTFAGQTLTGNEILVKFTYFGDADLSGSIDATDYSLIDNGYVNSLSGWINGDFDYSGTIDATDYALIDNAYVNQAGPLAEALIAEHARMFGGEYLAALRAVQSGVIPEPSAAIICCGAMTGIHLLRRRARRR